MFIPIGILVLLCILSALFLVEVVGWVIYYRAMKRANKNLGGD